MSNCKRMNKKFFSRAHFLFLGNMIFFFQPIYPVLVQFKLLQFKNKKIYVLSEFHPRPIQEMDREQLETLMRTDVGQLETLTSTLVNRDRKGFPVLHLMVEVPSLLAQERSRWDKVTHNIIERVARCQSIVAEDIEIRLVALVAYYLLDLPPEILKEDKVLEEQYNAGTHWCSVGEVTVDMLMKEVAGQTAEIGAFFNQIPPIAPYEQRYRDIKNANDQLISFLGELRARADERIIDLARRYSAFNRARLQRRIINCSSYILDLHILRKFLQSQQEHCLLIAGTDHNKWFCNALEQLGATSRMSEGSDCDDTPLSNRSFNIVKLSLGLST